MDRASTSLSFFEPSMSVAAVGRRQFIQLREQVSSGTPGDERKKTMANKASQCIVTPVII
jgi:hypothetical protein